MSRKSFRIKDIKTYRQMDRKRRVYSAKQEVGTNEMIVDVVVGSPSGHRVKPLIALYNKKGTANTPSLLWKAKVSKKKV